MPKKTRDDGRAVKIRGEAFRKLIRMQELVASRGWCALGIESTRQPTLSEVVEQAINTLENQPRRPIPTVAQR
jgi:hypothetical protein